MAFTKVLEMLGADKIDESKQAEIQEVLNTIIEAKASEIANGKVEASLNEEKEKLVEEFEKKFEDYKEDVTSKFSNFVDSILEEEMVIPEKIVRYARLGELYEDLIDQFKVRLAIDEGLLDGEVKSMLGEAKEEIVTLRASVNELTGQKLTLEKDARDLATHVYLRKKCDGLTESQKSSVMNILDGASKDEIDRKFKIVVESIGTKPVETVVEETETKEEETAEVIVEETKVSQTEVKEEEKPVVTETTNPMMAQWKRMLQENKF